VGPQLIPQASMGVMIGTTLNFTYGFEVQVSSTTMNTLYCRYHLKHLPSFLASTSCSDRVNSQVQQNSSVTLVVGNITNSSITNLQVAFSPRERPDRLQFSSDTAITALPFQAAIDSIELTLEAGFNPQLLLGATVFDNLGEIAAGAFLDLPSLSATLSYVTGVNASCDSVSSQDAVHGGLTNIVPSAVFDAGLFAEAAIGNGEDYSLGVIKSYQVTNYTIPLSTVCLGFDAAASTFGPAANPATTTTSSGLKSTSAAGKLHNPIAKMVTRLGLLPSVALSFLALFAIFASL
jgi:hypothetical protein